MIFSSKSKLKILFQPELPRRRLQPYFYNSSLNFTNGDERNFR